jgi:hypothetical protein
MDYERIHCPAFLNKGGETRVFIPFRHRHEQDGCLTRILSSECSCFFFSYAAVMWRCVGYMCDERSWLVLRYVSGLCCLSVMGSCDSLYPDQYSNPGPWNTKLEGLTTEERRSLLSFRILKKIELKKNKVHAICAWYLYTQTHVKWSLVFFLSPDTEVT